MIIELGGDFSSILTDRPIEIKGLGFHIRIEEVEPGVILITGLTDNTLSQLVIRPAGPNQIRLVEDAGRIVSSEPASRSVARPHRVLDAAALDNWMGTHYPNLLVHWQTYEADKMDLWEYLYDHHPDLWKEFEQSFKNVPDEGA